MRKTLPSLRETSVAYSERERKLLSLLSSGDAIDSRQLAERYYGSERQPFYAVGTINVAVKSLARKLKMNQEDYRLSFSGRQGPKPMMVRLEEKR